MAVTTHPSLLQLQESPSFAEAKLISSNPPQAAAVLSLPARPQPRPGLLKPRPSDSGGQPPAPHLGSRHHLLMKVAGATGQTQCLPQVTLCPWAPSRQFMGGEGEQLGLLHSVAEATGLYTFYPFPVSPTLGPVLSEN